MIRHLGPGRIAAMVEEHWRLAAHMARRLAAEPACTPKDVVLNQVLARFGKLEIDTTADRMTTETITRTQFDGICFAAGEMARSLVMRLSLIPAPYD